LLEWFAYVSKDMQNFDSVKGVFENCVKNVRWKFLIVTFRKFVKGLEEEIEGNFLESFPQNPF
jgi:hypothetical protein